MTTLLFVVGIFVLLLVAASGVALGLFIGQVSARTTAVINRIEKRQCLLAPAFREVHSCLKAIRDELVKLAPSSHSGQN